MSAAQPGTDDTALLTGGHASENDSARPLDTAKRDCPAERLPPELLAATFAYLSRRRRIQASHVSRYWRAAALGSPQLWARVAMTCGTASDVDFATTLMSRAGSIARVAIVSYYPRRYIDLDVLTRGAEEGEADQDSVSVEDEENDFDTIIVPYLQHIRTLWWSSSSPVLSLCHAAPFMERLHVTEDLHIQSDFLAGGSGALRTLRVGIAQLPSACPALSAVTTLRIDDMHERMARIPEIVVRVFTPEIAARLDIGGLPVRFDTTVYTEKPSYWPFQVAYNDR